MTGSESYPTVPSPRGIGFRSCRRGFPRQDRNPIPHPYPETLMKPFLMGTETEYAVSGRIGPRPLVAEEVYNLLNDALRHERPCLPDVNGGRALYLSNAGRFYVDSGGHPEYASPEVFTPA